ncbi:MAG: (2Fe-2S) ferredoxin domain-containing protein [Clostridia bacterium]|nr:(2Fe-2S) ferredoxin domain-containing protein [Clostridia bacterium]
MKTLAELAALRDKARNQVAMREGKAKTKIVVGMGTQGIDAGARDVLLAFAKELDKDNLFETAVVTQNAALAIDGKLPVVEVYEDGKKTATYVNMTADKAVKVVNDHIKGGKVVADYTL